MQKIDGGGSHIVYIGHKPRALFNVFSLPFPDIPDMFDATVTCVVHGCR